MWVGLGWGGLDIQTWVMQWNLKLGPDGAGLVPCEEVIHGACANCFKEGVRVMQV